MNSRATLSVVLLVVGVGTSVIVASGFGADPDRVNRASHAIPRPPETVLSDLASPAEMKLWNNRGCVTCHGPEGRGTQMGPDLSKVLPLYLAKYGGAEAAKGPLAAYILDPKGAPKLRDDGEEFMNPMPSVLKMPGGAKDDAAALADLLLRLAK